MVLPDGPVLRGRHHPRDAVWRVHAADEEVRPGLGHQAEAAEVRGGISRVEELFLNCCELLQVLEEARLDGGVPEAAQHQGHQPHAEAECAEGAD